MENDYSRGCFLIRNSKIAPSDADEVLAGPETLPASLSEAQLQAAARLKVALGAGRIVAIAGIAPDDCPSEATLQIARAFAVADSKPALIVRSGPGSDLAAASSAASDLDAFSRAEPLGGNLYQVRLDEAGIFLRQDLETSRKRLRAALMSFSMVLMDCGSFRENANGILMASLADGVVITARAGHRRRHELMEVREDLIRLKIPLLGVFLTRDVAR